MRVRHLFDLIGTRREVRCPHGGFTSFRYLLEKDGLGFSMSKTVVPKGEAQRWHYKHHLEACFCVSGKGVLSSGGNKWLIKPDSVYAADQNDPHTFQAMEDTVLICVFSPPLIGLETHGKDGSYARGR